MELTNYQAKANFYRGLVLNHFITLELIIEERLAEQFVDSDAKMQLMKSVILNRMTFESKKGALQYFLILKDENAGFKKTKNNSYPCAEILKELNELQKTRNRFAHYFEARSATNINYVLMLTEFRDNGNTFGYTHQDITDITNKLVILAGMINDYLSKA